MKQLAKSLAAAPVVSPVLILLGDHHAWSLFICGAAAYAATFSPVLAANIPLVIVVLAVLWGITNYLIDKKLGIVFDPIGDLEAMFNDLKSTVVSKDDMLAFFKAALADVLSPPPPPSASVSVSRAELNRALSDHMEAVNKLLSVQVSTPSFVADIHTPQGANPDPARLAVQPKSDAPTIDSAGVG